MNYILHIDGDGFFVSCELTRRPDLRGKPVVTGAERGIATALSYEAKALGLKRGDPVFKIRKEFPQVVVLPSDFELYAMMAERMYDIVRRFSPKVEEYSIDECFAEVDSLSLTVIPDLIRDPGVQPPTLDSGLRRNDGLKELARCVRDTLEGETGCSFSVGIAPTKTLAKVASNWAKPHGAVVLTPERREEFLEKVRIEKVWGIGRALTRRLTNARVTTALSFACKDEAWIRRYFHKPQMETWLELNGTSVLHVSTAARVPQSIQRTRTFGTSSSDRAFLWTQLSQHTEEACGRARHHGLFATRASFFLKTNDFRYGSAQVDLPLPTNSPQDILARIAAPFAELFDPKRVYRATGITLLAFSEHAPEDLFGGGQKERRQENVNKSVDMLDAKYGKHTVFLASSLRKEKPKTKYQKEPNKNQTSKYQNTKRPRSPRITDDLFRGESTRHHLRLPHLGLVG